MKQQEALSNSEKDDLASMQDNPEQPFPHTPLKEKAFALTEAQKIDAISKHFGEIMDILGLDLRDDSLRDTPVYNESIMEKITPIIRERTNALSDVQEMISAGELDYYFVHPEIDTAKVIWKKGTAEDAKKHLSHVREMIESYSADWNKELLREYIFPYADEAGRGDVLWPLRFSLSGRDKSPDPFTLLEVLGKEIALERIKNNIDSL